jgi:hypothetical protein
MLTTGFKFWIGLCTVMMAAAVFAGYTTGGTETGPVSLGWKGGVGNHVAYVLLVFGASVMALLGLTAQIFRDGDAEATAEVLGLEVAPEAQVAVGRSWWPVFAAVGLGVVAVGLVVDAAVFVVGLCILAAVGFEWTMTNWSERATGDPATNRELRERLMRPIEIPVLGAVGIGVLVLAISRVLLASSVGGAVGVATVIGIVVFGCAMYISRRPALSRGLIQSALLLGAVAVLTAGIVAAVVGERDFHHKGKSLGDETHEEAGH